jgi:hypothetical protein
VTRHETEALEADIARQREELAHTVDELQARLDVKSRAREKAHELKDRATTDTGRPRPEVTTAAVAGAGVLAGLVGLRARRSGRDHLPTEGNMPMHKLTLLAAGGVGYVLGSKAGRTRYEQIRSGARRVAHNPTVRNAAQHAQEAVHSQAPAVKEKVAAATAKVRHHGDRAVGVHTSAETGTNGAGPTGWPSDPLAPEEARRSSMPD